MDDGSLWEMPGGSSTETNLRAFPGLFDVNWSSAGQGAEALGSSPLPETASQLESTCLPSENQMQKLRNHEGRARSVEKLMIGRGQLNNIQYTDYANEPIRNGDFFELNESESDSTALDSSEIVASKRRRPHRTPSSSLQFAFPVILYEMLSGATQNRIDQIAAWLPHGRAFRITDRSKFEQDVLPKFFNTNRFTSFTRQMGLYHFTRIRCGRDKGAYYHESFLRGRPDLASTIQREPQLRSSSKPSLNAANHGRRLGPPSSPDFYKDFPPCTELSPQRVLELVKAASEASEASKTVLPRTPAPCETTTLSSFQYPNFRRLSSGPKALTDTKNPFHLSTESTSLHQLQQQLFIQQQAPWNPQFALPKDVANDAPVAFARIVQIPRNFGDNLPITQSTENETSLDNDACQPLRVFQFHGVVGFEQTVTYDKRSQTYRLS